jgi:DNA-binding beta-propeller fold protein YncE
MFSRKSATFTRLICIFILIFLITSASQAKSLYIGMHNIDSKIRSYKISSDQLQYQTNAQGYSFGWTGITLDPYSGIAFATAEDNHNIFMLNAHTMIFEGTPIEVVGALSLAGIVFDQGKQKLYIADRQTQHLLSFGMVRYGPEKTGI